MDLGAWWNHLAEADAVLRTAYDNALGISRVTPREFLWQALVYVLPFLGFAGICYWRDRRRVDGDEGARPSLRGYLAHTFPRAVYLNRSSGVDLKLLLAGRLINPLIALGGAVGTALVASATSHGLSALFPDAGAAIGIGPVTLVAFTLFLALVYDGSTWIVHALHHRVRWLWPFHAVHHSARTLSPLTAFRHHPVYELLSELLDIVFVGPATGLAFFLLSGPVGAVTVLGVNLVFAVFQFLGAGLRHSHLWLSLGPVLGRIVISPAQHQIHHSADPRHHDRNFGEVFAVWDWLFGTLYVPEEREEITYGLSFDDDGHEGLADALVTPFREAWAALRGPDDGADPEPRSYGPSPTDARSSSW